MGQSPAVGGKLNAEALPAQSPALPFPPAGIRKEVLQLGEELFSTQHILKHGSGNNFAAGSTGRALPVIPPPLNS